MWLPDSKSNDMPRPFSRLQTKTGPRNADLLLLI
mgnify:CR=1